MKICFNCLEEKDRALFGVCQAEHDGLQRCCKECVNAAARAWRKANPEAARATDKRWRVKNPEKAKLKGKAWVKANREHVNAAVRAWRKANLDAARAIDKKAHVKNREKRYARNLVWRENNRERYLELCREGTKQWRLRNPETVKESARRYAQENPEKVAEKASKRRALQAKAMPQWLTDAHRAEIKAIYAQAGVMTQLTGIAHHVDHEVPLKGKLVCGLHVPWNLRVVTAHVNQTKWNHFDSAALSSQKE